MKFRINKKQWGDIEFGVDDEFIFIEGEPVPAEEKNLDHRVDCPNFGVNDPCNCFATPAEDEYVGCKTHCYHPANYKGCICVCHSITPKIKHIYGSFKARMALRNAHEDMLKDLYFKMKEVVDHLNQD